MEQMTYPTQLHPLWLSITFINMEMWIKRFVVSNLRLLLLLLCTSSFFIDFLLNLTSCYILYYLLLLKKINSTQQ